MFFLIASSAFAGDLVFSTDRPGVGDARTTVGAGHAILEMGGTAFVDPTLAQAYAAARIGVHDAVEIRLLSPLLTYVPDTVDLSGFGVGAKFDFAIEDGPQISLVPEAYYQGALSTRIGVNISQKAGAAEVWGTLSPAVVITGDTNDRFSMLAGIGVAGPVTQSVSLYANAGGGVNTVAFVGGGTAILVGSRFQVDLGCDVTFQSGGVYPQLGAGLAFGF